MSDTRALDRAWLAAHPLPSFDRAHDKNSRGRLLCVGGGPSAPGALLLTGEAAFRAGCGKVQIATAAVMVPHLAAAFPEAGMIALPADEAGEIDGAAAEHLTGQLKRTDAAVIGCGTSPCSSVSAMTGSVLEACDGTLTVVLDAGACVAAAAHASSAGRRNERLVLIPHPGEMAALMGCSTEGVTHDPVGVVISAVARFGAVVALRGEQTVIGAPGEGPLIYPGDGIGLATGGSGDVCAGVIGGLAARGADPLAAAAWGIWAHGEAGRQLGPPGFLARELLALLPGLLNGASG